MSAEQFVKVPAEFFKKAREEYSDWRFAWVREVIQNSYDSGATSIRLNFNDLNNDKLEAIVEDNGCGMSQETLVDKFLALGGSTKRTSDNQTADGMTGSFGAAKLVILMCHDSYEIETGTLRVRGQGGTYSLSKTDNFINGTKIRVVMDKTADGVSQNILTCFTNKLIENADFRKSLKLYLQDEEIALRAPKFRYKAISDIGTVSFSDNTSDYSSRLYVRINGIPMFEHNVWNDSSSNFTGVLDLFGTSLTTLTSNRDSLKAEHRRAFNSLIETLSRERTKLKLSGGLEFKLNTISGSNSQIEEASSFSSNSMMEKETPHSEVTTENKDISEEMAEWAESAKERKVQSLNESTFKSLYSKSEAFRNSIETKKSKIDEHKYPFNFKIKAGDEKTKKEQTAIFNSLKKQQTIRLAHMWKSAVSYVIASLLEDGQSEFTIHNKFGNIYSISELNEAEDIVIKYYNKPVFYGFIFSEEVQGTYFEDNEFCYISLNPEKLPENFMFEDILDIALHEVTHFFESHHNEYFISKNISIQRTVRRRSKTKDMINKGKDWFKFYA